MYKNWTFRDGWRHQIGWIFGKAPNGLWHPPHFWNLGIFRMSCCNFFRKALFKAPKCKINWIENDPPVLELFQKFIRFSGATRPLMSKMQKKTSGPIIPHSFLVMCFCSILVYRQGKRVLPLDLITGEQSTTIFLCMGLFFVRWDPKDQPTTCWVIQEQACYLPVSPKIQMCELESVGDEHGWWLQAPATK